MSLMGTLAKVAIGVAVAKGVSSMAKGTRETAGAGSLFDGGVSGGGLEDMMKGILGGQQGTTSAGVGGIGGLLDELGGLGASGSLSGGTRPRTATHQPNLGDLLGQLTGGAGSSGGGLGELLGSLGAAGAANGIGGLLGGMLSGAGGGSLGDMLNSAFTNGGEPDAAPPPAQELAAALLLKAMIQAAKADGKIDASEQAKLMDRLGDVSAEERAFVERELSAPVDVGGLAAQIPEGLETQSYTMSVMAIDLDSQAEAQYLHQLATALGLEPAEVNHIHDRLGVPKLYS